MASILESSQTNSADPEKRGSRLRDKKEKKKKKTKTKENQKMQLDPKIHPPPGRWEK